jgi:plasmid stabilization system protein ParE
VTTHSVALAPFARTQLTVLFRYIATESGPETARRFTGEIVAYCEGFATFPLHGRARDDIRPGLRTIGFRRRVTIAFEVEADRVMILGIFYGGQDYETLLQQ